MSSVLDFLGQQLDDERVGALAAQLGADPEQTKKAIGAALPTLVGAVSRNAANEQGAQQLHQALQRDHDGSLLDHLGSFLGKDTSAPAQVNQRATQGGNILGHILGGKQGRVESGVSQASGLDVGQSSKLLAMLAPMLMGALGRKQRENDLSPGGMSEMLKGEQQQVEASSSAGGSLIGRMLDQDGDGDFDVSDIMKLGMGKLFGK